MATFPTTLEDDCTEVRDALEIARTQYTRGELADATRWLRTAADLAFDRGLDRRGVELSKAAADLTHASANARPATPRAPAPPQRASQDSVAPVAPPRPPAGVPPQRAASAQPAIPPSVARSTVPARPMAMRDDDKETNPFLLADAVPEASPVLLTERKKDLFDDDELVGDEVTNVAAPSNALVAAIAAVDAVPVRSSPAAAPSATGSSPPRAAAPVPRSSSPAAPKSAPRVTEKPSSLASSPPRASSLSSSPPRATSSTKPSSLASSPPRATASTPSGTAPEAPHGATAHESVDATSPGVMLGMTASVAAPIPLQALRVALVRTNDGVRARVLVGDVAHSGEVEVLVVATSHDVDLVALFGR